MLTFAAYFWAMISFFKNPINLIYVVEHQSSFTEQDIQKLDWLFGGAELLDETTLSGTYLGPRKEMITPWSTNAVEITQNMGIEGIDRIEELNY